MPKKSSSAPPKPRKPTKPRKPRIPLEHNGVQVNFCKNPRCYNFGIPPLVSIKGIPLPPTPAPGAKKRSRDGYTINARAAGVPVVTCDHCGQKPPMKSNKGVYGEYARMSWYLDESTTVIEPCCPNTNCKHFLDSIPVTAGTRHYVKDGRQDSGAQRYICRECNRKFSVNINPAAGQNKSYLNGLIFRLLVNKMPLQRICEVAQISMSTLYNKIDFIYDQCQAFAASHERRLPDLPIRRLQISIDRQDYMVNWSDTVDKRNVILHALGSADNRSGFVFGMHLNFDPDIDRDAAEKAAQDAGDYEAKPPFREFARFWLQPDYVAAAKAKPKKSTKSLELPVKIAVEYQNTELREDVESFEEMNSTVRLPKKGMQIHGEYTMYGHFRLLKHLLPKAEKIRFYMEKESGIRAACLAAFAEDVRDKRVDAFYVKINKDMSINQKNRAMALGRYELDDFRNSNPHYADISDQGLRALLFEKKIHDDDSFTVATFKDKWYLYPAPMKNEPEKAISWLTDTGSHSYSNFHLAKLMLRASLFGIDRFFMQVRRRISLLERPISSSSSSGRRWYGYSPYNPAYIGKLLGIFRVYHNYVNATDTTKKRKLLPGEKKRNPGEVERTYSTPAMRLRLVDRQYEVEEVLKHHTG